MPVETCAAAAGDFGTHANAIGRREQVTGFQRPGKRTTRGDIGSGNLHCGALAPQLALALQTVVRTLPCLQQAGLQFESTRQIPIADAAGLPRRVSTGRAGRPFQATRSGALLRAALPPSPHRP